METLAFLLLVAIQRNSTGVVSISMEVFNLRFPSNDGIRPNTSQYVTEHCVALRYVCPFSSYCVIIRHFIFNGSDINYGLYKG
jgi:hypothetical protein